MINLQTCSTDYSIIIAQIYERSYQDQIIIGPNEARTRNYERPRTCTTMLRLRVRRVATRPVTRGTTTVKRPLTRAKTSTRSEATTPLGEKKIANQYAAAYTQGRQHSPNRDNQGSDNLELDDGYRADDNDEGGKDKL